MHNNQTVITVLGMVRHTKIDHVIDNHTIKKIVVNKEQSDKAVYSFGPRLIDIYGSATMQHFNMLPLLCTLFDSKNIIPIYTQKSRQIQEKLLLYEGYNVDFLENRAGYIDNEKDFTAIFSQINTILQSHESIIIDITHGFRHLPVLATIALMIENIRDIHKIEHIFFAKEVKAFAEYEIIDLKEYLDVANIAFALASFNTNYTVAHSINCIDTKYQELIDTLSEFSEHILSNAIIELMEVDNSLIERILDVLKKIDSKAIEGLSDYIQKIQLHLMGLKSLKNLPKSEQLFRLAKNMYDKGYYLNAITLLNESVGYYGAERFRGYSQEISNAMDAFLEGKDIKTANYELANQTKLLIKNLGKFSGTYLGMDTQKKLTSGQKTSLQKKKQKLKQQIPQSVNKALLSLGLEIEFKHKAVPKDKSLQQRIIKKLTSIQNLENMQEFIVDIDNLRNNLAHANSSYHVSEIKLRIQKLLDVYVDLCYRQNILSV